MLGNVSLYITTILQCVSKSATQVSITTWANVNRFHFFYCQIPKETLCAYLWPLLHVLLRCIAKFENFKSLQNFYYYWPLQSNLSYVKRNKITDVQTAHAARKYHGNDLNFCAIRAVQRAHNATAFKTWSDEWTTYSGKFMQRTNSSVSAGDKNVDY